MRIIARIALLLIVINWAKGERWITARRCLPRKVTISKHSTTWNITRRSRWGTVTILSVTPEVVNTYIVNAKVSTLRGNRSGDNDKHRLARPYDSPELWKILLHLVSIKILKKKKPESICKSIRNAWTSWHRYNTVIENRELEDKFQFFKLLTSSNVKNN